MIQALKNSNVKYTRYWFTGFSIGLFIVALLIWLIRTEDLSRNEEKTSDVVGTGHILPEGEEIEYIPIPPKSEKIAGDQNPASTGTGTHLICETPTTFIYPYVKDNEICLDSKSGESDDILCFDMEASPPEFYFKMPHNEEHNIYSFFIECSLEKSCKSLMDKFQIKPYRNID